MRKGMILLVVSAGTLSLTACSEAGDYATEEGAYSDSAEIAEAGMDEASGEMSPLSDRPDIPVNLPKMAYIYDYGFRLGSDGIPDLQQRHADLCVQQGPYVCQIVSMNRSGSIEDEDVRGRLELAVIADKARAFGKKLDASAEDAGGEQIEANITGEDLSKNMVDTEARLRSRIVLRDRMMEVLRTRKGSVAELVEAERSVAQINQEIDQARSWLEEMKGRVAYARVNIDYASANAPASDFLSPVAGAFGILGSLLGNVLAALIVTLTISLPLLGTAFGLRWAIRRWKGSGLKLEIG